jgi:hypothetical protein
MKDFFDRWVPHFGSGILARPLLAVLYSSAYVYMSVTGIDPGDAYVAITTAVVLWFFKSQDEAQSQQRLTEQQTELVSLAKQLPPDVGPPRSS